jgi:hypothetical protein
MFRGPAAIMQRNPRVWWVFGGALAAVVLAMLAGVLLPGQGKWIGPLLGFGMLALYPPILSGALKPKPVSVALYVDQSGIYADDAPFALRQDIAEAYIRPAFDARARRFRSSSASFSMTFPAWPLTVELITRKGRALHIDPGGHGPAADILTALGFPVTMCAPDYTRRPRTTARQWVMRLLVVVLFFAAVFGYSYYKSTGH